MEYWSYGIKERVYESMSARVYETMQRPDRARLAVADSEGCPHRQRLRGVEGGLRALEYWGTGTMEWWGF